ncbi:hypothetical protein LWI29_023103 [Acer saccharum]|uniref:Uncharacterized protein n=1 Tax=Acer saccharum TaxID=4024 RepID=A0AA39RY48_ACESA|nr:hypothetical protein LWI29_023103 [Acer saccharum]
MVHLTAEKRKVDKTMAGVAKQAAHWKLEAEKGVFRSNQRAHERNMLKRQLVAKEKEVESAVDNEILATAEKMEAEEGGVALTSTPLDDIASSNGLSKGDVGSVEDIEGKGAVHGAGEEKTIEDLNGTVDETRDRDRERDRDRDRD